MRWDGHRRGAARCSGVAGQLGGELSVGVGVLKVGDPARCRAE